MNPTLPERRSSEPFPDGLEGWFNGEISGKPVACTVWDLSATGMLLVVPPPADIPLEFELRIPHEGAVARVRLVWASGHHYGVQFSG